MQVMTELELSAQTAIMKINYKSIINQQITRLSSDLLVIINFFQFFKEYFFQVNLP